MPRTRPGPCTDAGLTHTTSIPAAAASASTTRSASHFDRSYWERNEPR